MKTERLYSKEELVEKMKARIMRDRLRMLFKNNQKSVAKILAYFIRKNKLKKEMEKKQKEKKDV